MLYMHKSCQLRGQISDKIKSGYACGKKRGPKTTKGGGDYPKGISLNNLHALLGVTETDTKQILERIVAQEITLEQMVAICTERKEHYRVVNAACHLAGVDTETELYRALPAVTKQWLSDQVHVFKGSKKSGDIPLTFITDMRVEQEAENKRKK